MIQRLYQSKNKMYVFNKLSRQDIVIKLIHHTYFVYIYY